MTITHCEICGLKYDYPLKKGVYANSTAYSRSDNYCSNKCVMWTKVQLEAFKRVLQFKIELERLLE